ncbi:MAG: hypothetical protein KDD02_03220 [Phaeodactylibacter sp.]|nr:hypothetical protein [Phaeodactylibacter sp.]MCB9303104.1 hypothetical protein [Lewinellaceae bacterium]
MSKARYKEVQRFRRWEVIALLLFLLIGSTYHLFKLIGESTYDQTSLILQYLLILVLIGGALVYFISIRLIVKFDDEKIRYQFYPWHYHKHEVKWSEVADCQVVDTPAAAELSGWSVRIGTGERSFSVSGRRGLLLSLKDGQQLFIGSQHPDQLREALEQCRRTTP